MSIIDKVDDHSTRLEKVEEALKLKEKKKDKFYNIKIPWKIKSAIKKDTKKVAAICIGANRRMVVKLAFQRDGVWWVGEDSYEYEEVAVYYYNKTPVIIVLEWRLMAVGGRAEEYRSRIIGGEADEAVATALGIKRHGQQTIIRGIQQAELDKDQPKKGGMGWLVWVIVAGGIIYLASKFFGGG